MTVDVAGLEWKLIEDERIEESDKESTHPITQLLVLVSTGDLKAALTHPLVKEYLHIKTPSETLHKPLKDSFSLIPPDSVSDEADRELLRVIIAAACLNAFVQINWTGPDLDINVLEILDLKDSVTEVDLNALAVAELAAQGEPAYHLTRSAILLRLSQFLLQHEFTCCQSASLWRQRAVFVHQQVLDEPVALSESTFASTSKLDQHSAHGGRVILERGLLQHQVTQDKEAANSFLDAARSTGLKYRLTGALGKRTKWQEHELSQLVVIAESRTEDDATPLKTNLPETLDLNDDTLLEQTKFTSTFAPSQNADDPLGHIDPSNQPALAPIDQCILLGLCVNVKNTSPAHGLTTEQMKPYVARVISHPVNWSIHTMALLLRSRLESARTRTVERSTLQLQALIDQMPTADSTFVERIRYFYDLPLPSKWDLERELAERFLSIGAVRSALEIFERLEMWEDVVKCWSSMEQTDKAKAIVKDLLEGRKEEAENVISRAKSSKDLIRPRLDNTRQAKLWCLLGDLEPENALEHYTKSWEISGETSGRAMRSLGGYYFAKQQWDKSIECLRRAVTITPLLSRSWFLLGCSYIREEDWEGARDAFARCVTIDDEDGESWNNLASMYLRITSKPADSDSKDSDARPSVPFANKQQAFRALKQGLKHSYDNWRMWANFMVVSVDVGELAEACRALGRLVEIRSAKIGAESVDEDVLDRVVDAVTRAPSNPDDAVEGSGTAANAMRNPNEGHGLLIPVTDLFKRVLLPRISSPRVFRAYGRLMSWKGQWAEAVKAYLDAYKISPTGTLEAGDFDKTKWVEALSDVEDIVDILRNFGPRVADLKWQFQARSIVRSFMGRTKEFEDEEDWQRLVTLQEELRS